MTEDQFLGGLLTPGPTRYKAAELRKEKGSKGLLEAVGTPMSMAPNAAVGLLGNVLTNAQYLTGEKNFSEQGLPALSDMVRQVIATQVPAILRPLVTYHGSPAKFDEFKQEKIGTGEGAQAYGYGHYVAENPSVALDYKERLSLGQKQVEIPGYLYKVDLADAAIPKMLDWDKPLSQQPALQSALATAAKNSPDAATRRLLEKASGPKADSFWQDGGEFYRQLTSFHAQNAPAHVSVDAAENAAQSPASSMLRQAGIPGIQYLDQGSRAIPGGPKWLVTFENGNQETFDFKPNLVKGIKSIVESPTTTHNFVIFPGNEGLLNILERNNQPVVKGLLGQ